LSRQFCFIVFVLSCLVCIGWGAVSLGQDFEKQHPALIPPYQQVHPFSSPKGGDNFCLIQYDADSIQWYFDRFEAGDGIAVLMDPADCGFDSTYPFKINQVHFYLYNFGPAVVWPAQIRIRIRDIYIGEDTLMPGTSRYYADFSVYEDLAYDPETNPYPVTAPLDEVVCVDTAFFLEVLYNGEEEDVYPSLIMSDTLTDMPDTNENWVYRAGSYWEWYDHWYEPIPGRAIIRVTGYPYAIDCEKLCWKWMSEQTHAPNGMSDLDQYQFGVDTVAMSGPAALADLLVWLNALPSIADADSLIRLLSYHFHTDPSENGGTLIDSMQAGLDSVFAQHGLSLRDTVVSNPKFSSMEDSLRKDVPIALLVGLWQKIDNTWHRIGGHYVAMAGACKSYFWVALSDPGLDNAEIGGRGRFLPPHELHEEDHTLHNTEGYVSHDAYLSDTLTIFPDTVSWILRDLMADSLPWVLSFDGLNFQPGQGSAHSYDPAESLYAVVEYALMILEKPTLVEEEETSTPTAFELHQSYPNPFNDRTVIRYSLSRPVSVSLTIYNILGQKVRMLVKGQTQSGRVSAAWDGKDDYGNDLSSGIYFYRLQAGELSETKKMVLLH
jgi:hypothetical protein